MEFETKHKEVFAIRRGDAIPFLFSLAFLALLIWPYDSLACSGPGAGPAITMNGYLARGYGDVATVLSFGTIYLQMRRCGFGLTTFGLFGLFVLIVIFNDGWHYSGLHGDCGYKERDSALHSCYFIGALLLWQVGQGLYNNLRRKNELLT